MQSLDMECKTMLLACSLSVIISSVFAQEESVSINKPRTRMQQPWVQINTDHVRCFCNLPPCVATGYMCKSSSGGCFSDLLDSSRSSVYRGRHGCVEYLSESQRSRCPISNNDGQLHVQNKEHPKSLLVCCTNDLCNHVDNPHTKNLLNNTLDDTDGRFQHQDQENFLYSNSEVWFRAATIAVPICGAVILFVLIALAVKILKSEDRNSLQHKLGPAMYVVPSEQKHCQDKWNEQNYKQYLSKKPYYPEAHPSAFTVRQEDDGHMPFEIPLLVEIRDVNNLNSSCNAVNESKNDANAKLNLMQCDSKSSKSIILEIGKSSPNFSMTTNINLNSEEKFDKSEKAFLS